MERIFSGVQPSGIPTIGNYVGALKQFVDLQNEYETYYCVVNQHAITVPQNPAKLREQTRSLAALYLALGVDPNQATVFVQSDVPAHAQAAWMVECLTPLGQLERMTQYKDKVQKQQSVQAGLLTYPALMVADIILYQANLVPVGDDQTQHIELTRDFVDRFNRDFAPKGKEILTRPERYTPKSGGRIMSLQDPTSKMSKSDSNQKAFISLLDEPKQVTKKIKSAVTDSSGVISYDPEEKAGISNLLTIYQAFSGQTLASLVDQYANSGYGQFKADLAEVIISVLEPMQAKYQKLYQSSDLDDILRQGASQAKELANQTLADMEAAIGFSYKL
ncbi:tryptophan--tRNA ligase [Aerococcus urinaehominis]|uniref:Tryptophan--tRNA ligase n=1 Tax=Aerococcus urinaehominis TaxID=128944 RepID=A0A0X8FLP9_9LACT|nr:tryptophan--tRNA ligase [Aerococcus urinaehominis]AMB99628.1 tryptophan--tRNA ligase [Aerococcus urinaehominis]SDL87957.1 tryptophanyl-tRNA synthetase [Aerococcus urinaehominis]